MEKTFICCDVCEAPIFDVEVECDDWLFNYKYGKGEEIQGFSLITEDLADGIIDVCSFKCACKALPVDIYLLVLAKTYLYGEAVLYAPAIDDTRYCYDISMEGDSMNRMSPEEITEFNRQQ